MRGYFGIGIEGVHKPMNLGALLRSAHELLLQSRERFVRPLSFLEKKQMRSCLRGIAGSAAAEPNGSASSFV